MKKIIAIIILIFVAFSCETGKETSIQEKRPAYLIASSFMPERHGSLDAYYHAAHPLLEAAGGETIIAGHSGQKRQLFEGTWKKDAAFTVFKFPSMDALLSFWNSLEYQNIKHLRTDVIPPNFTFATEGFLPIDIERYKETNHN